MFLPYGVLSIVAAILILLGIGGDGPIEAPFYQRVLGAVPFIAFGVWSFWYDIPLLFGKDDETKRIEPPWLFTLFVVASILVLLGFHKLLFDMLSVAFDYWLAFL